MHRKVIGCSQDPLVVEHLHSDLRAALDDCEDGSIHHKFLITSLYYPIEKLQIERINAAYIKLKGFADEYKARGQYFAYLFITKRPSRLDVFVDELLPLLKDQQYWKLLAYIWTDAEGPGVNYPTWSQLFASKRPFRDLLMNKAERTTLAAMPEVLTVYRGGSTKKGLSWTLSEERARWFAERFKDAKKPSKVFQGTVPKSKVYAYLDDRQEQEIVVNPRFVTVE